MVTDPERREAARRLRSVGLDDIRYSDAICEVMMCADLTCVGDEDCHGSDERPECVVRVFARLADLIEPSCDRDALLALAAEMAADSVRSAKKGSSVSPVYILHAARNIAEACGETFGSIRNRELAKWGTSIVPKETIVDRDALLKLARYMDKDVAETEAHFSNVISTKSVSDYARRIREACGEVGR